MSSKPRKKLGDTAAQFIFGEKAQPEPEPPEPKIKSNQKPKAEPSPLLEKLIKDPQERVKPVRVSLDLDPDTHKRLTDLANRLGRKKSEVLRILVAQALDEFE
jgi:hypothetical protein